MEFNTEENSTLNRQKDWGKKLKTNITTSIKNEIWMLAKQCNLNWNEALEFGIQFILAEDDICDYPKCKLYEKVEKLTVKLSEVSQELNDLKENKENTVDKNVKDVSPNNFFNAIKKAKVINGNPE